MINNINSSYLMSGANVGPAFDPRYNPELQQSEGVVDNNPAQQEFSQEDNEEIANILSQQEESICQEEIIESKSESNEQKFALQEEDSANSQATLIDLFNEFPMLTPEVLQDEKFVPYLDIINFDNYNIVSDAFRDFDGKIDSIEQGYTGDCWLLGSTLALGYSDAGKEIIKDTLEYQKDGIMVHFKGAGDYFISNQEIIDSIPREKTDVLNHKYSQGDTDMKVIELAMEKVYDDINSGKLELNTRDVRIAHDDDGKIDGAWEKRAIYILTGKEACDYTKIDKQMEVFDKFEQDNNKNAVLTAALSTLDNNVHQAMNVTLGDGSQQTINIETNHTYAIQNISDDKVTFSNPWDSTILYTSPKTDFLSVFNRLTYCDLND